MYKKKKNPFTYRINILVERDRKHRSKQVKKIISGRDKCFKGNNKGEGKRSMDQELEKDGGGRHSSPLKEETFEL